MRKSDRQRQLRRQKTQAIVRGSSCKHEKRTALGAERGYLICSDCGALIKIGKQGEQGAPLTPDTNKKGFVMKSRV